METAPEISELDLTHSHDGEIEFVIPQWVQVVGAAVIGFGLVWLGLRAYSAYKVARAEDLMLEAAHKQAAAMAAMVKEEVKVFSPKPDRPLVDLDAVKAKLAEQNGSLILSEDKPNESPVL